MKAVVVNQASTGVEVVEHDLPKVGHGEALVKVEYCGVCHTDLHVAHGDFGQVPGRILGHEGNWYSRRNWRRRNVFEGW